MEFRAEKLVQAATFYLVLMVFFWWCSLETEWLLPFWLNKALVNNTNQCQGFLLNVASDSLRGGLLLLAASTRLLTPKGAPVSQSICFHANSTPTCLLLLFANYTRWKDKCLCFAFLARGNSCKNTLRCSPSAWGEECLWNRDLCLGNWQSFSAEFKIKEEKSVSWLFSCL